MLKPKEGENTLLVIILSNTLKDNIHAGRHPISHRTSVVFLAVSCAVCALVLWAEVRAEAVACRSYES